VAGRWFYPDPPVSSTNKNDRHDITDILLKVALNTIKQTSKQKFSTSLLNLLPHLKVHSSIISYLYSIVTAANRYVMIT